MTSNSQLDAERATTPDEKMKKGTTEGAPAPESKTRLILLLVSLCLAVLCQALDNTVITTAIPRITDAFDSLNDVGWYGSGYLLTTCAFQLSYGKLYNIFPTKWVFLIALGLFELGSLVCGAAPSSVALIMGRVVQGIGAGGIFSGAILILAAATPLEKRPIYNGLLGSMFAIASVAGPLMGGAFTDRVTWRLCFYINLPFGLVTAISVMFFLSSKTGHKPGFDLPLKEKVKQLDSLGLMVFIPCIVSFLLALTWGGSIYAWSNWRIILLFVVAALTLVAFTGVQYWQGDKATVPLSVIKQRTVWACATYASFLFGGFLAFNYYLPVWFQAIKGDSAIQSGIHLLPSILSVVMFSLLSGGLVTKIGYYSWACILSTVLAAVGAGLLTTFKPTTSSAEWIGYQILFGAGCGLVTLHIFQHFSFALGLMVKQGLQIPLIAIQKVLPETQVAEGTSIIIFIQTFGGSIFIAVAQSVFNNKLLSNVVADDIPVNPGALLTQGATQVSNLVAPQYLDRLRLAYNESITQTLYVCVATAALSIFGSALIPWLSIKKDKSDSSEQESQDGVKDEK